MAKQRLYLAYGSNMNLEQMSHRCPTAKVVGTIMLENWHLIFNGVASIERSKGNSVPVVIWEIQSADERALDVYEGWPRLYRKEMRRIKLDGKLRLAMVYIMNNVRRYSPPSAGYYNVILEGYKSAGFDIKILQVAANRAERKNEFSMNATIKEQIMAVRAIGETNMLDVNAVMQIANREGFYELVVYLMDHKLEYVQFILTGRKMEGGR